MRIMRSVLGCLGGLALLALAAVPAKAGDVNCANPTSCGFGTATGYTTSGAVLTSLGGDNATFTESVYENAGIYTYVFTISNSGNTLASANTLGDTNGDHFASTDSYGVLTGSTTSSYSSAAFAFNPGSLTVCFDLSSSGCTDSLTNNSKHNEFTFYVQSANGPTDGTLSVTNSGPTNTAFAWDPAPEPSALVLLGITVLLLAVGIPVADRRLRAHTA
jgi:hypothetical protein